MMLIKRKKIKIIIIIATIFIVCAIILIFLWAAILVNRHNKILRFGKESLYVVPVEEEWEPLSSGEEISLGYATLRLEPNDIESVSMVFPDVIKIKLKEDIQFVFMLPTKGAFEDDLLPEMTKNLSVKDRRKLAEIMAKAVSFEGKKETCYTQPVSTWKYLNMDGIERGLYLSKLIVKWLKTNDGSEIVIYNTPHIKGILWGGVIDGGIFRAENFDKNYDIFQVIRIDLGVNKTSIRKDKKMKSILSSLRYTIGELPDEEELGIITKEALKKLPWYVEEDPETPKDKVENIK